MNRHTRVEVIELRKLCNDQNPKKIDPNLKRDLKHGWLLPYLVQWDELTWKRWDYWGEMMHAGELIAKPIPLIDLIDKHQGAAARKNLETCLNAVPGYGEWQGWGSWEYLDYFLNWLLFGFGYKGQPELPAEPRGCTGASMRLYQIFDLSLLMLYPYDYWGEIMAENRFGRGAGFYPTPEPVVNLMVGMLFCEQKDHRAETVMDPCVGTGRMLLHASNYSLRLYGMDINESVIKAALVNGYCYAPWLVKPFPFLDAELVDGSASAKMSDLMTGAMAERPDVAAYLDNTEHDESNQWKFEPIKKRRKKGTSSDKEPEVLQGLLF